MSAAPADDSPRSGPPDAQGTSLSLLERIRRNEAEAWEQLIVLYAPLVMHWCRRAHLPEPDAADVFQEVFQAVAAGIEAFRKEKPQDTFRGWLRTITHHKICDHFRQLRQQPHAVGGTDAHLRMCQFPAHEIAEDDQELQVVDDLLVRALEMIRGDFRVHTWQAFWRVVIDGQRPVDVAGELEMSPGAVRVAKARVLQRLRQQLGESPS